MKLSTYINQETVKILADNFVADIKHRIEKTWAIYHVTVTFTYKGFIINACILGDEFSIWLLSRVNYELVWKEKVSKCTKVKLMIRLKEWLIRVNSHSNKGKAGAAKKQLLETISKCDIKPWSFDNSMYRTEVVSYW